MLLTIIHWEYLPVVAMVLILGTGVYKCRGLETPQKELHLLKYTFLLMGALGFILMLNLPRGGYTPQVVEQIADFSEAKHIIMRQSYDIQNMYEQIEHFQRAAHAYMFAWISVGLSFTYNFAKIMVNTTQGTNKGSDTPTSIFDKEDE